MNLLENTIENKMEFVRYLRNEKNIAINENMVTIINNVITVKTALVTATYTKTNNEIKYMKLSEKEVN